MTAASTSASRPRSSDPEPSRSGTSLGRATLAVSTLNLVSRATGLARVVAMSAALGATALGDTYQAANLVSNILFELLAGGILSAALVPTFVDLIDRGRRSEAAQLGGVLLGAALAGLAVVVGLALVLAPQLMGLLTLGIADGSQRVAQNQLGVFLLWFFLPQVLLYAVGAVATALLHADRRFVAAAVAPVFNNLVVIGSMVLFWVMRGDTASLDLAVAEKLVLGAGATTGVLAMTLVPLVAVHRSGLGLWPRWDLHDSRLRPLAAQGAWAAGHLGLNQAFAMVTVIVAGRVAGGVVAYQVAFTFFLLPYALLANPLTTTLYPRLAAGAAAGHTRVVNADVSWGLRTMAFVLVPASFLIAVLARPILEVIRLGNLDVAGAGLVAAATSGYMAGLVGYAAFFLLTRASYALGDTRTPTMVSLVATALGVVGLFVGTGVATGTSRVVVLGVVHAVMVSAASLGLLRVLRLRIGTVKVGASLARDIAAGAIAALVAWFLAERIGMASRPRAVLALAGGGSTGLMLYLAVHALLGGHELRGLRTPGSLH